MLHIATIIHGFDFNILFPVAKHYDLEIFLNSGYSREKGTANAECIYDFKKEFPEYSGAARYTSVIWEMYTLADALLWLHEQLNIKDKPGLCCAHMDFTPANILIDAAEDSPAGKWKITDFGISVFQSLNLGDNDDTVTVPGLKTIGDLGIRLANPEATTIGARLTQEGTYHPPEAHHLGSRNVGRKSDIWSFGCVLMMVLTFALGGTEFCDKFGNERLRGQKGDFFYFVEEKRDRLLSSGVGLSLVPNRAVETWLKIQPKANPELAHWLTPCAKLIKKMLQIEPPKKRPGAKEVSDKLKCIYELARSKTKRTTPASYPSGSPTFGIGLQLEVPQEILNRPSEPSAPAQSPFEPTTATEAYHTSAVRSELGPLLYSHPYQPREPATPNVETHINRSPRRFSDRASSEVSPDVPPQSPVSWPSSGSLLTATTSSVKYSCRIPRDNIQMHSLSPDGQWACFLYSDHIRICCVSDGSEIRYFRVQGDVSWKDIRMSGSYLAIYGIRKDTRQKSVCRSNIHLTVSLSPRTHCIAHFLKVILYNIISSEEYSMPDEFVTGEVSCVIVSKQGFFGFVSGKEVKVFHFQYDTSDADLQPFL
jgi:serine/threonine protein kinase